MYTTFESPSEPPEVFFTFYNTQHGVVRKEISGREEVAKNTQAHNPDGSKQYTQVSVSVKRKLLKRGCHSLMYDE